MEIFDHMRDQRDLRIRTRVVSSPVIADLSAVYRIQGTVISNNRTKVQVDLPQRTEDVVHPGWQLAKSEKSNLRLKQRFAKLDLGGPFTSYRRTISVTGGAVGTSVIGGLYAGTGMKGSIIPVQPLITSFPNYIQTSNADLWGKGATAISRTRPGDSNAELLTFLIELKREGIPTLDFDSFHKKLSFFKSLGNDYLKVEFGWKPFVREIRSLAQSMIDSEKSLADFKRARAQQHFAVRYEFPEETTESSKIMSQGYGYPVGHTRNYVSQGALSSWNSTSEKTWFSGSFENLSPISDRTLNGLKQNADFANKLLGTYLTPEVVWNVMPWSWAIDWLGNIGDIISNIPFLGDDGLVLHHGYIMRHSVASRNYELRGLRLTQHDVPSCSISFQAETKLRRRASPYGFGLNLDGFSAKQWSILAALGLSRGPGSVQYD